MTRGTTAASSVPAKDAGTVERRWMSVVFLQGEEADPVLHLIERAGPEVAIRHLSQWDYGDETRDAALVNGYVYDEIPQGSTDRVLYDNASTYALTFNHQFGYVSLLRHFPRCSRMVLNSWRSRIGSRPLGTGLHDARMCSGCDPDPARRTRVETTNRASSHSQRETPR